MLGGREEEMPPGVGKIGTRLRPLGSYQGSTHLNGQVGDSDEISAGSRRGRRVRREVTDDVTYREEVGGAKEKSQEGRR